jgi:hypothetical protein
VLCICYEISSCSRRFGEGQWPILFIKPAKLALRAACSRFMHQTGHWPTWNMREQLLFL